MGVDDHDRVFVPRYDRLSSFARQKRTEFETAFILNGSLPFVNLVDPSHGRVVGHVNETLRLRGPVDRIWKSVVIASRFQNLLRNDGNLHILKFRSVRTFISTTKQLVGGEGSSVFQTRGDEIVGTSGEREADERRWRLRVDALGGGGGGGGKGG